MTYRFKAIIIKILAGVFFFFSPFLVNGDKMTLIFIGKCKGTRILKTISSKQNKIRGLTLPDFKASYNQDCGVGE